MEVERRGKARGPADPDNQRTMKVPCLTRSWSHFSQTPPGLYLSLLFPLCFFSFPLASFTSSLDISVCFRYHGSHHPSVFLPLEHSAVLLWLRTQEGHHLVTRHLSQMPLQGDLATTAVAFGLSPVNMCRRCLSPTHTRTHQTLVFWQRTFFTTLQLGILNLELAPGILTFANHYMLVIV